MTSSRRSSRPRARNSNSAARAALGLVFASAVALSGCAHFGRPPASPVSEDTACAELDSALAQSGLRNGVRVEGRATIDVEQYRVRGRFSLTLSPEGDLVFELTSTMLLGGRREDAVLSFFADTLRVLDREGGRYYEGVDVDAMVADGLGEEIDLAEVLRRATGQTPDCRRVAGLAIARRGGATSFTARIDGEALKLRFEGDRLVEAAWPLARPLQRGADTVEARYDWRGDQLAGVTVMVPEQRWRVKLVAEQP